MRQIPVRALVQPQLQPSDNRSRRGRSRRPGEQRSERDEPLQGRGRSQKVQTEGASLDGRRGVAVDGHIVPPAGRVGPAQIGAEADQEVRLIVEARIREGTFHEGNPGILTVPCRQHSKPVGASVHRGLGRAAVPVRQSLRRDLRAHNDTGPAGRPHLCLRARGSGDLDGDVALIGRQSHIACARGGPLRRRTLLEILKIEPLGQGGRGHGQEGRGKDEERFHRTPSALSASARGASCVSYRRQRATESR